MFERPGKPSGGSQEPWDEWRNVLAALRIGLSLAEIRRVTMRDFIAYADLAYEPQQETTTKEATQADIDALLG